MASTEIMEKAALKFAAMPKEGQDKVENILYGMQIMYEALKDRLSPDKSNKNPRRGHAERQQILQKNKRK